MANETPADAEIIRVEHAIVLQNRNDIRALNDLLSVGWKVSSATPMGENVVTIIEHFGTQEVIAELREALGFNDLTGAR